MKKQFAFVASVVTCLAMYGQSQPQQVVAGSGGNGQSGDTFMEWTLGEPVIATLSSGNIMLTQGFQQSELTVTAIKTQDDLHFTVEAYPNPTGDLLMIQVDNTELGDFQYVLYDMNGKVLEKKALAGTVSAIGMTSHPPGIYLLKITQLDKEIKMFEIIKN
jgi:hypothetical protein